jgi:hypothetical protein
MSDLEILANLRQVAEERPERERVFWEVVINRFFELMKRPDPFGLSEVE